MWSHRQFYGFQLCWCWQQYQSCSLSDSTLIISSIIDHGVFFVFWLSRNIMLQQRRLSRRFVGFRPLSFYHSIFQSLCLGLKYRVDLYTTSHISLCSCLQIILVVIENKKYNSEEFHLFLQQPMKINKWWLASTKITRVITKKFFSWCTSHNLYNVVTWFYFYSTTILHNYYFLYF